MIDWPHRLFNVVSDIEAGESERQTFFIMREGEPGMAQRTDFVKQVETTFKAAAPMMRFLTKAVGAEF